MPKVGSQGQSQEMCILVADVRVLQPSHHALHTSVAGPLSLQTLLYVYIFPHTKYLTCKYITATVY